MNDWWDSPHYGGNSGVSMKHSIVEGLPYMILESFWHLPPYYHCKRRPFVWWLWGPCVTHQIHYACRNFHAPVWVSNLGTPNYNFKIENGIFCKFAYKWEQFFLYAMHLKPRFHANFRLVSRFQESYTLNSRVTESSQSPSSNQVPIHFTGVLF